MLKHTVKRNDAENEDNGQGHDHDRVDLKPRRLIGVQSYSLVSMLFVSIYPADPSASVLCPILEFSNTSHLLYSPSPPTSMNGGLTQHSA
jgi:hypothetical protein